MSDASEKWEYSGAGHEDIHFKKACDLVRREVLYNILIECGIIMKLGRLIEVCLNEIFSKHLIGKHLCDAFHVDND